MAELTGEFAGRLAPRRAPRIRAVLSAAFVTFAVLKLAAPAHAGPSTGSAVDGATVGVELVIALAILVVRSRVVYCGPIIFALGSFGLTALRGGHTRCACLGHSDASHPLILIGISLAVGVLSVLGLEAERKLVFNSRVDCVARALTELPLSGSPPAESPATAD